MHSPLSFTKLEQAAAKSHAIPNHAFAAGGI